MNSHGWVRSDWAQRRGWVAALACLAALALPALGSATVAVLGDDALVGLSSTIAEGRVVALHSEWNDDHNQIHTIVTIRVSRLMKGAMPSDGHLVLRLLGGQVDDLVMEVVDQPTFALGEEVIVFVRKNPRHFMPVTGLYQGKFTIVDDPGTGVQSVVERAMSREDFVREVSRLIAIDAGVR